MLKLVSVSVIYSFLLVNNTLLYVVYHICLSIQQLIKLWVICSFGYYE